MLVAAGVLLLLLSLLSWRTLGSGSSAGWMALGGAALLLWGVAGALGAVRLAGPASRRVAAFAPLAVPVCAAILVTRAAIKEPEFSNYAGWTVLWLIAIAAVVASALLYEATPGKLSPPDIARRWLAATGKHGGEVQTVCALTGVALLVRLIDLGDLPYPFSGDEAAHALQSDLVHDREITNPFRSGLQGQPNAYYFALAAFTDVFGYSVEGTRTLGVVLGTLTVPVMYLFLRAAFGVRIAVLGAAYLVAYHFALHYSRLDLNNVGEPLVLAVVALFVYRAATRLRPLDFGLTGIAVGLGLYVSAGARIAGPVVIVVLLLSLVTNRQSWQLYLVGLPYLVAGFVVAAMPLGWWWIENPEQFMDRLNVVGIYQSGWLDREMGLTGKSEAQLLWEQVKRAFGAWGYYGDRSNHYGASTPLVDPLSLPFFLLGAGIALRRFWQPRYAIPLAIIAGVTISGGVLTETPPTTQRLLAAVPAAVTFVAVGVDAAARLLSSVARRVDVDAGAEAAYVILGGLMAFNFWYYFAEYPDEDAYSDGVTRIAFETSLFVDELPHESRMLFYGDPVAFSGFPVFQFLLEDREMHDVFQDGRIDPPRSGPAPAVHVFMPHRAAELEALRAMCPDGELRSLHAGDELFTAYLVGPDCTAPALSAAR
jgi:4-amino-4-deoxy-L-arabinose transferase-like glycosyltransferase